jgi:predicted RNA-binding protein YlxR (DUF448 family)
VCRSVKPKGELLRVVRSPDGILRIDPTGRANGRGAYVCRTGTCLLDPDRRGGLARALGAPVPAWLREELVAAAQTLTDTDAQGGSDGTK